MNDSKAQVNNKINKPMRILYIQKPTGGGSTISLYELVKGLDTSRYEPIILFLQENKYLPNFNKLGIRIVTLDISTSEKKKRHGTNSFISKIYRFIIVDLLLALRIAWIIKKERIDIVHQNLAFEKPVMVASRLTQTPEVFHFRHFGGRISFFTKCLISSVDAALYTTQAIADYYLNQGITVTRSKIVYEPIDIQRFSEHGNTSTIKQQLLINDNERIVSNIGRITPWKGQHYFLQAMENIVKQYPKTKILIVGEPGDTSKDKKYFRLLQQMAQKKPLNGHVIFTGNRDDIVEIMSASNIVVHSASEPEPFGLVIAEAMAVGTPVIATQGGGPIEIIKNGETGILVPMKNSTSIKEAIQKLFESKVLSETISIKARKDVMQRFSIGQHVEKVQKTYEEIIR